MRRRSRTTKSARSRQAKAKSIQKSKRVASTNSHIPESLVNHLLLRLDAIDKHLGLPHIETFQPAAGASTKPMSFDLAPGGDTSRVTIRMVASGKEVMRDGVNVDSEDHAHGESVQIEITMLGNAGDKATINVNNGRPSPFDAVMSKGPQDAFTKTILAWW